MTVTRLCTPFKALLLALLGLAASGPATGVAEAGKARIAVASNFTRTAKALEADFETRTGHEIAISFGSTGKLFAQAINGAPFDVLLAADQARPSRAIAEGIALADSRFTYAIGKLALYSIEPDLVQKGGEVMKSDRFTRFAIGNPKTAPYGLAGKQVLESMELYRSLRPKLVFGENIGQTYQFVVTGNAELGLVASSQVMHLETGSKWLVPDHLYEPIRQDAVLLTHGRANEVAKDFLTYLEGDAARKIITSFGYGVE